MDFGNLLSRSLKILRSNRVLWVLGFLAALGGIGSNSASFNFNLPGNFGGSSTPSGSSGPSGDGFPPAMRDFFDRLSQPEVLQAIFLVVAVVVCVLLIIGFIFWLIGLVANGGLIAGVDRIETQGHTSFSTAWSAGASKLGKFVGMRMLLLIPSLLIGLLAATIFVIGFVGAGGWEILRTWSSGGPINIIPEQFMAGILGSLCFIVPLAFIDWVYEIIAGGIKMFADRAITLHGASVTESIRTGWQLFRGNFVNVLLMGLILWVIALIVGFVIGIVALLIMSPTFVLAIAQAPNFDASTFVVGGLSLLLVMLVSAIMAALFVAYKATLWTLVYRQLAGSAATFTQPFAQR
jgi:hypothetical protein